MKTFIFTTLLLFGCSCFAQISKKQLMGDWLVQEVIETSENQSGYEKAEGFEEKKALFVKTFEQAKFSFQEKKFIFSLNKEAVSFMKEVEEMFNNQNWAFNYEKQIINVGNNILNIEIIEKSNGIYFFLDETPLLLKMRQL